MLDIYRKCRKKSDFYDIFENMAIFSNPGVIVVSPFSVITNLDLLHVMYKSTFHQGSMQCDLAVHCYMLIVNVTNGTLTSRFVGTCQFAKCVASEYTAILKNLIGQMHLRCIIVKKPKSILPSEL